MRFLYGALAFIIMAWFISYGRAHGMTVSDDAILLCLTIAFAGGMAGGD